jgi:Xaa-Pro aminopeptidase
MFDQSLFAERRQRVMDLIGPTGVLMVASLPERLRNGDAHFSFRQHSDVSYLAGFGEPQTVLLLCPGSPEKFVMFVRPRDPEMETWDGRRAGIEGVCTRFGADVAYPITELAVRLPSLISGCDEFHTYLHAAAVLAAPRWTHRRQPRLKYELFLRLKSGRVARALTSVVLFIPLIIVSAFHRPRH